MLLSVNAITEDTCAPLVNACMNLASKVTDRTEQTRLVGTCNEAMFFCNEHSQVAVRTAALLAGVAAAAVAGVTTWAIMRHDE